MTRIFIARHGNTFDPGDIVTRVGARTDLSLSSSGRDQAIRLGKHFSDSSLNFDVIYCSTLRRTKETAELILRETGSQKQPEVLEFLTEIDYGPDENLPEEAVLARVGHDALRQWEDHAIPPQGWVVDPLILKARWKEFFNKMDSVFANETVLVVTSNGIARFALQAIAPETTLSLKLKTGAYAEFLTDGHWPPKTVQWNVRP